MAVFISAVIIGLTLGTIYGLMSFGVVASYRVSRVVNLGQAGIAGWCAAGYFWMTQEWAAPVVVALLAMLLVGTLMGGLMGWAVVRMNNWPKGLVMIVTLAATLLLFAWADLFLPTFNPTPPSPFGEGGFDFLLTHITSGQVGTFVTCILVALGMTMILRNTRFGLYVRAISDAPDETATLGIPFNLSVIGVWGAAGTMAALAGILITNRTTLDISLLLFVMVWGLAGAVLGGMESFSLAFVGGLLLGTAQGVIGGTFGGQLPPGVENLGAIVIMGVSVLYAGTKNRHLAEVQT